MTTLKIGTPKEIFEGEARVAMTPESALQLQKLGYDCAIETGAGMLAGFSDKAYAEAGVEIKKTAAALWKDADIIAKVREPDENELKRLKSDHTLISFFNPAGNEKGMQAAAKKRHQCYCHGNGSTNKPGSKNGRLIFDGQYCRVQGSYRGWK